MSSNDDCGETIDRWFYCEGCSREIHDPYAELGEDGRLYGRCECGQRLEKEGGV